MGAREARIFSEVFWYTVASMSIEKAAASATGGRQGMESFDPARDGEILDNAGGDYMGRSAHDMATELQQGGSHLRLETWEATNGNKAVVGYGDAFKQRWLGSAGVTHASSAASSLTTNKAPFYAYFGRGTCHQYANSNFLRAGYGAATTSGFGHVSSAIWGYYGGQLWPKISYSAWQSEKRW